MIYVLNTTADKREYIRLVLKQKLPQREDTSQRGRRVNQSKFAERNMIYRFTARINVPIKVE